MSRFKIDNHEADIEIEIDHLVFRGMDLSPERAGLIRERVEEELRRMIGQEGISDYFPGQEVSQGTSHQIEGTGFQIGTVSDDERLARELADHIFRSIEEMM